MYRVITLLCVGCGLVPPESGPADHRALNRSAPEHGLQFRQPDTLVAPGEEVANCWVPSWIPAEDIHVTRMDAYQSPMGHHTFGFRSLFPRPAGEVFDCTSLESMVGLLPLMGPNGIDGGEPTIDLPEHFVFKVPKDTTLVIQSHYVNSGTRDIVISDLVNLFFLEEGVPECPLDDSLAPGCFVEANFMVANHATIQIPASAEPYTTTTRCTVDERTKVHSLIGHMHDWGSQITIDRLRGGGRTTVYSVDEWQVEYRDYPPVNDYSIAEPLVFEAGDSIEVTCSYANSTGQKMLFPTEMCVMFAAYFPANDRGFVICD